MTATKQVPSPSDVLREQEEIFERNVAATGDRWLKELAAQRRQHDRIGQIEDRHNLFLTPVEKEAIRRFELSGWRVSRQFYIYWLFLPAIGLRLIFDDRRREAPVTK